MTEFLSLWPWRGRLGSDCQFATTRKPCGSTIEMIRIASEVATRHDITLEQMKAKSSGWKIAHARQEAMAAIYATGRFSLPRIGRYFDMDHTTVLYACRAVEARALAQQEAA